MGLEKGAIYSRSCEERAEIGKQRKIFACIKKSFHLDWRSFPESFAPYLYYGAAAFFLL